MGFVYIAGAGPGNLDYMTVKCLEIVKAADCIIYDSPVDSDILMYAKSGCVKIHAGKRKGRHSYKQEEINQIIVDSAKKYEVVLRLKGGDPFVFGRGGEECLALQENGIDYEVVPGISSCIAVPEVAGMPVTHRNEARSFTVITGHSATGRIEDLPFETYAKLEGTLVFLMSITHIDVIMAKLLEYGMPAETPVSIIVDGTNSDEYIMRSNVGRAAEDAASDPHVRTPGIIMVGNNAAYDMRTLEPKPLSGMKIGVVGTNAFVRKMSAQIGRLGGSTRSIPMVHIEPLMDGKLEAEIRELKKYDNIVFTSRNTIDLFFDCFYGEGYDIRDLAKFKFVVIGKATGDYLKGYHLNYDYCPERFTSDGLGDLILREGLDNLFIPRAVQGNNVLSTILDKSDCKYYELPIYDTQIKDVEDIEERTSDLDYLVFASSMGVKGFFAKGGVQGSAKVICIGEYTYREAIRHCKPEDVCMSEEASAEGIIESLLNDAGSETV